MEGSRQAGFTIVEITMFLAISGMLFLIALLGTGNTIRMVRFMDSGRSLEAFVQKQYDDLVNGFNSRSSQISCNSGTINLTTPQTVGTSNCLLIGKLLVFRQDNSNVTVYNVIGTEPANVNYSQTDTQLVTAFQPRAVTQTGTNVYSVPWGARASGFERLSDNQATNGLLLIRSPKSTRIINYTYEVPAVVNANLTTVVNAPANTGQEANFCIASADGFGAPAKLVVKSGSTQAAASIAFDANSGDCNGT